MKEMTGPDSGNVVDVAYKAVNGEIRVMPWSDVDPLAVAYGGPWREFPWYLGQRHYSGMYWCATEAKLVGYESLLELSRLLMADFDRSSKHIVSQPFQIKVGIGGERLTRGLLNIRADEQCSWSWRGRHTVEHRMHHRRRIQGLDPVIAEQCPCENGAQKKLEDEPVIDIVGDLTSSLRPLCYDGTLLHARTEVGVAKGLQPRVARPDRF